MKLLVLNRFTVLDNEQDLKDEIEQGIKFILDSSPYKDKDVEFVTVNYVTDKTELFRWFSDLVALAVDSEDVVLPIGWTSDRHCMNLFEVCQMYGHKTIQVDF